MQAGNFRPDDLIQVFRYTTAIASLQVLVLASASKAAIRLSKALLGQAAASLAGFMPHAQVQRPVAGATHAA